MKERVPIRIMIVDDRETVRRSLMVFLRVFDDFLLAGQAANGMDALKLCDEIEPDVILMDVNMPVMDGITAIQLIHEAYPKIHMLAMSSFEDETVASQAMRAGASGYFCKSALIDDIAEVIRGTINCDTEKL